jgi:hypothetical protein
LKIRPFIKEHSAWMVGGAIAGITLIDLAVLAFIGTKHPRPDTLSYELAKACMQVLGVVGLGAVLSFVTAAYQCNRQEEDRRRDERQRHATLVRDTLRDELLSSYNAVKHSRRVLQTWPWDPQRASDLVKTYDGQMALIDEAQLNFERLAWSAPTLDSSYADGTKLQAWFRTSERYLYDMLNEWRQRRPSLVESPPPKPSSPGSLQSFAVVGDS